MHFDSTGKLLHSWGGGHEFLLPHGITGKFLFFNFVFDADKLLKILLPRLIYYKIPKL